MHLLAFSQIGMRDPGTSIWNKIYWAIDGALAVQWRAASVKRFENPTWLVGLEDCD